MWRRAGAERPAQPDLADALEHRDERDVGDPDRADEQRHAAEQQEERVEVVLDRAPQLRGSGGAATLSRPGSLGLSATGAWRAIRSTAPIARLDLGERRAPAGRTRGAPCPRA